MKKTSLTIPFFLLIFTVSFAQDAPFWKEIKAFKRQDSISFPPKKAIVFTGSSSFTIWKNLQQDFPDHKVINRGFGGSSLPQVIQYADLIVLPYKPKQVVIYCGENDLAIDSTISPEAVAARFEQLFKLIRQGKRKPYITYVSMKPSPRRQALMPKMEKANALIADFLKTQRRTSYIDIYHPMLDTQGNPRKELFTADDLHMNANGYTLWQKIIEPHLK
jgi:lysophospholipase L1-like esterase